VLGPPLSRQLPVKIQIPGHARGAVSVILRWTYSLPQQEKPSNQSNFPQTNCSTRKRWYESAWPGAGFWRGANDTLPVTSYITYPAVSVPGQQFLDPDPDAAIAISVAQRSCAKLMYFGLDVLLFCPIFAHVKLQHKEQRKILYVTFITCDALFSSNLDCETAAHAHHKFSTTPRV